MEKNLTTTAVERASTSSKARPRSLFLLPDSQFRLLFGAKTITEICRETANTGEAISAEEVLANPGAFENVEILFCGWGSPCLDANLLACLPQLRCVCYAAGSVRTLVSDAFFERGILLCNAARVNGDSVADYTLASILLCLKRVWHVHSEIMGEYSGGARDTIPGVCQESTVGIISLGVIGQRVCEKLGSFGVKVIAYDPYADAALFAAVGAERVDSLDAIFRSSEVVTLHAPSLPETENMLRKEHFDQMLPNASFINTARGQIVNEMELSETLKERPDLFALIDVVQDESDYAASPLAALPNVMMTSHISGAIGRECTKLGVHAWQECQRFLRGEPFQSVINQESLLRMA